MKSLKCDDYCVLYDNVTGRVKVNFKKGVLEQFSNNNGEFDGVYDPADVDPCGPVPPTPGGGDPPKLNTVPLSMSGGNQLVATAYDQTKIANITSYVISTSVNGVGSPTYHTLQTTAATLGGSTIKLDLTKFATPLTAGTYGFKVYPLSSTITTWQASGSGGFASNTAILPYGSGGGPPPKLNGGPLTMVGGTNLIALADDSSLIANITKYVISTTINGVGTPTYNTLPKAAAVATGSTITLDLKQLGTPLTAGKYGFKVYPLSSTITTRQASGAGGFASGTVILAFSP